MNRLFNYVFMVKQERLHGFLYTFLKKYYGEDNIRGGNKFLVAKGTIPVALVAHLDTVHRTSNRENLYFDPIKKVAWSPNGLGADDRAGVYAILEIIKRGYRPHVIFTHDEETGAGGAREMTKFDLPFAPNFLIELDRRGYKEAVFYDCGNKAFQDKILTYGFKLGHGTFSDISVLAPAYDLAAVNLGIGYYHEHSKDEILFVDEMFDTVNRVINILEDESHSVIAYNYQKVVYTYKNYYKDYDNYDYPSKYDTWSKNARNPNSFGNGGFGANKEIDGTKKNIQDTKTKEITGTAGSAKDGEIEEDYSKLTLDDFNYGEMKLWSQKKIDRYYALLYDDNSDNVAWFEKYYSGGMTQQGNEFIGDVVSDDADVVNHYLSQGVM